MARDEGAASPCGAEADRVGQSSAPRVRIALSDWPQYRFAFHDKEEVGPVMLSEIARHTGLRPDDL